MTRGIHTQPNKGKSTTWLSPYKLIEVFGPFDLDPCCPAYMPWRTANTMLTDSVAEKNPEFETKTVRSGLFEDWNQFKSVWMNPPYGENENWLEKILYDSPGGLALLASRTEVDRWFVPYVWEKASAILFLYGRLYYHYPDGKKAKGNAGHGSIIAAYGDEWADKLKNQTTFRGRFIDNRDYVKEFNA